MNKKLIACGNILPEAESLYLEKGKVIGTREYVLIAKTLEKKFEAIKKEIRHMHPYKIPCVIKIAAEPNKEFTNWVKRETT